MKNILKNTINTYYPDMELISIIKIESGLTNFNYKVIGKNNFVLFAKIFRSASIEEINAEVELVNYLSKQGVLVPAIYKNKYNKNYTSSKNINMALYEYIEGSHPKAIKKDVRVIGGLIASLHLLPVPDYISVGYKTSYKNLKNRIVNLSINIEKDTKELLLNALNLCRNVLGSNAPKGLIHTDIFLDNCVKSTSGNIYMVDFEEAVIDHFVFDIGRTILGCCMVNNSIDMEIAHSFIVGYTEKRALVSNEIDEIYDWVIFSILISIMWRYTEFNINRPNENKNNIYKEFIPSLKMIVNIGKVKFLNTLFSSIKGSASLIL